MRKIECQRIAYGDLHYSNEWAIVAYSTTMYHRANHTGAEACQMRDGKFRCAIGTYKYLVESPEFDTFEEAVLWLQIQGYE